MRHRIKKIPTLSKLNHKLNHHLLHSDKSTNTALRFGPLSGRKLSNLQRLVLFSPEKRGFLEKMKSYVYHPIQTLNTYFYNTNGKIGDKTGNKLSFLYSNKISTIPLVLSAFGLLLVLGMMMSPSMAAGGSGGVLGRADKASAVSEQDFGAGRTVSLSIINNGNSLADGDTVSTNVETPGTVSYIDNTIRINTNKIAKYYVGVQAAEDGTSDLIGTQYMETITGVGENISPSNFSDNTWGYSLTDHTTASNSTLTYSTLPAYNTNSPLQYTSTTNPADGNHDLKLTFAAKINANKPGDHYQTKAMVSVAADAKELFETISTMQEMTPTICNDANVGDNTILTDVSAGNTSSKTYAVQKMPINGECWMIQNMDNEIGRMAHDDEYGGYYDWNNAKTICTKMGNSWNLPSQAQYQMIINSYDSSPALIASPYKFAYGGFYLGDILNSTTTLGHYWSSTPSEENAYGLGFTDSYVGLDTHIISAGFSVRCVVKSN